VEGIGQLEHQMDDFPHAEAEMQASIDSQTSMMHDLFGHFGINPNASFLHRFNLGGGAGCPSMSLCLSCFVPSFPVILSLVSLAVPLLSS
jgi:hypothetical protein